MAQILAGRWGTANSDSARRPEAPQGRHPLLGGKGEGVVLNQGRPSFENRLHRAKGPNPPARNLVSLTLPALAPMAPVLLAAPFLAVSLSIVCLWRCLQLRPHVERLCGGGGTGVLDSRLLDSRLLARCLGRFWEDG